MSTYGNIVQGLVRTQFAPGEQTTTTPTITLADLARVAGGWPISLTTIGNLLARADRVLKDADGRATTRALTRTECKQMGYPLKP